MTTFWYGGDLPSYNIGVGPDNAAVLQPGSVVWFYTAQVGGGRVENLADATGTAINQIVASSGDDGYSVGAWPRFRAPLLSMWAQPIVEGEPEGPRVLCMSTDLPELLGALQTALSTAGGKLDEHVAAANPHQTTLASLADTSVGPLENRPVGSVVGVVAGGGFGLLTPAQTSGAILLNPRNGSGVYTGQSVPPPDPAQGQNGPSWFRMQATYSAADNLPDMFQLGSTTDDGRWILTGRYNGNGEGRDSPSARNRVARRIFEFLESLGGASTARFFELSTNPANASNREPLFGAYGTSHGSMPGWMVMTRVAWAQRGVRAGGSHNGLSAINFRGLSVNSGPPVAGVWVEGDVYLDKDGRWWLCTATGEPGTWIAWAGGAGGGGGELGLPVAWTQDAGAVAAGTYRYYNLTGQALTLRSVVASVGGDVPAGASVIVQVQRDGVDLFASPDRPTITAGQRYSGVYDDFTDASWPAGSWLTASVQQVGSTTAGSKLTIQAWATA